MCLYATDAIRLTATKKRECICVHCATKPRAYALTGAWIERLTCIKGVSYSSWYNTYSFLNEFCENPRGGGRVKKIEDNYQVVVFLSFLNVKFLSDQTYGEAKLILHACVSWS